MQLRGWRRVLASSSAALVLLWIAFGIAANQIARSHFNESQAALDADFATYRHDFEGDLEWVQRSAVFESRDGGDVSTLMRQHVRVSVLTRGSQTPQGSASMPKTLMDDLERWRADWPAHFADSRLPALDVEWFSTLESYGYWAVDSSGSFDSADLHKLARLRLLVGLSRAEPARAAYEVRQLVRLLISTEDEMALYSAIGLLHSEAQAWQQAKTLGQDVSGWQPVSDADRRRLSRVAQVALETRSLLSSEALGKTPVGPFQCVALRRGLRQARFLDRYLGRALRHRIEQLEAELARSSCRSRLDQDAVESYAVSTRALCGGGSPCEIPDVPIGWLPFVRFPLGSVMLLTFPPRPFEAYSRLAPAP